MNKKSDNHGKNLGVGRRLEIVSKLENGLRDLFPFFDKPDEVVLNNEGSDPYCSGEVSGIKVAVEERKTRLPDEFDNVGKLIGDQKYEVRYLIYTMEDGDLDHSHYIFMKNYHTPPTSTNKDQTTTSPSSSP